MTGAAGPYDDRDPLEGWDRDGPGAEVIDLAAYRPHPPVTPARIAVVGVLVAAAAALWTRYRRPT